MVYEMIDGVSLQAGLSPEEVVNNAPKNNN